MTKVQTIEEAISALKECYPISDDPFDESAKLSYYMDSVNELEYEHKNLERFEIEIVKYGITHGGSDQWAQGRPSKRIAHQIQVQEYENDLQTYRVLKKKSLGVFPYKKIIGKRTPQGGFVPAKQNYPWVEENDL